MSLMAPFCAALFPRDVLDEIWDLIESVSEGFPTYYLVLSVAWSFGVHLVVFLLLRYIKGIVLHPKDLQVSQYLVSVDSSSLALHRLYS